MFTSKIPKLLSDLQYRPYSVQKSKRERGKGGCCRTKNNLIRIVEEFCASVEVKFSTQGIICLEIAL